MASKTELMARLSSDLRDMGMEPSDGECPECGEGQLWNNSHEQVCDECAAVVDKDDSYSEEYGSWFEYFQDNRDEYTYDESERKKCIGAFLGSYEWGPEEDGTFTY